jgi:hypothetical protein
VDVERKSRTVAEYRDVSMARGSDGSDGKTYTQIRTNDMTDQRTGQMTDEGFSKTDLSTTSLLDSDFPEDVLENDRIYPAYGQWRYGLPTDKEEQDRMFLQHEKYLLHLKSRLFFGSNWAKPSTNTGNWYRSVISMK